MGEINRGYKSGGEHNEYLITLDIDLNESNTNLARDGVADKNTAKFRCKKAYIVSIIHKDTNEAVDSVRSYHDYSFIYKVGSFIEEPSYDSDVNKVCSNGIHFFLSKERALLYGFFPSRYITIIRKWFDNGQLQYECEYKNGKKEGLYKSWHYNGKLRVECEYKNDVLEGPYKIWHENGQLYEEGECKNDEKEGLWKEWRENGQLYQECEYKNGKEVGLFRRWYENGQLNFEYHNMQ